MAFPTLSFTTVTSANDSLADGSSNLDQTGVTVPSNAKTLIAFWSEPSANPTGGLSPSATWDPAGANQAFSMQGAIVGGTNWGRAHVGILQNPTAGASKTFRTGGRGGGGGWQAGHALAGFDETVTIVSNGGQAFTDSAGTGQVDFSITGITTQAGDVIVSCMSDDGGTNELAAPGPTHPTGTVLGTASQGVGDSWSSFGYTVATGTSTTITWRYPSQIIGNWGDLGIKYVVLRNAPVVPVITQQPASTNVVNGTTATFSVASDGAADTYQWQDNSSGSFADIGGATSRSYTTASTTSLFQRRQYRVNATNANGTTTSSAATLTLSWHDVYLRGVPSDANVNDVRLYDPTVATSGSDRNGALAVTLDALTLAGTGALLLLATGSVTLDALTAAGTGALAIKGTASVTLADMTVAGTGALAIAGTGATTLGALTLAGTGALLIQGAASVTLEDLTLAGTGTLNSAGPISGTLSVTLADMTVAGAGALAIQATGSVTLDALTVAGTGQLPAIGTSSVTLADMTVAGTGALLIQANGSVTMADMTVAGTGFSPRRWQM
jgi:hypothetical protein